ncbi:MAG: ATP-binding protein [Polyangiaceae bacterium]|nr:ATP-binding protein [Polyangiaceae bacterium]
MMLERIMLRVRFLDRRDALARLGAISSPGLGVLWGRRRVGKTRLLLEWCRAEGGLYTVADQSAESVQRRYFADAVGERVAGFAEVAYPDWRALLAALARRARHGEVPSPLIVDELPYLVASCPSRTSTLQAWVDHGAKQAGIRLVVAGSSQRMMQGLVLDRSAPLFGRAAQAFALEPLSPAYLGEALGLGAAREAVEAYAVWGGTPWYWELAAPSGGDLVGAVDALVLDPAGPLHREPERLLLEEQPSAAALRPLLDAIGAGAHRVSEIAGRVGQPATSLARPLSRLVELGLVRREVPFGEPERATKRALYRIDDPFFRLWFRMVVSHKAWLAVAGRRERQVRARPLLHRLAAECWEELCRRAVPRLGSARLGGRGPFGPAARHWHGSAPEHDVVARSLDGGVVLLGEAKWSERAAEPAALDRAYRELVDKGLPPAVRTAHDEVVHALFVAERPRRLGKRPYLVLDATDVLRALA